MTERKAFRLTGTQAELGSFLRSLQYTPDITVLSTAIQGDGAPDSYDDDTFGQVDVVEMIVHFGIAMGAHATWDVLRLQFESYRSGRRHLKLEEVTEPPNEEMDEQFDDKQDQA